MHERSTCHIYQKSTLFLTVLFFMGHGLFFIVPGCSSAMETGIEVRKRAEEKAVLESHPIEYSYTVINTYPHDPEAFTQGLFFENGYLYEGTGLYGRSTVSRVEMQTGKVDQIVTLPSRFFGEGITIVHDRLIQLTWRAHVGFVYDKKTLMHESSFHYTSEGWGITSDGERLIMSDGSEYLFFLDIETYRKTGSIQVLDGDRPLKQLNELEYITGLIFANVWKTSRIAIIDPSTGSVTGWIDLQALMKDAGGDNSVKTLNGIAYNREQNTLLVTGKFWPRIYEIRIFPPSPKLQ